MISQTKHIVWVLIRKISYEYQQTSKKINFDLLLAKKSDNKYKRTTLLLKQQVLSQSCTCNSIMYKCTHLTVNVLKVWKLVACQKGQEKQWDTAAVRLGSSLFAILTSISWISAQKINNLFKNRYRLVFEILEQSPYTK